jgi:hypothetical protein
MLDCQLIFPDSVDWIIITSQAFLPRKDLLLRYNAAADLRGVVLPCVVRCQPHGCRAHPMVAVSKGDDVIVAGV